MPQTFQVLRCYKCAVFQVHLTKKANKWNCKLCGEKQSIKRFYGLGTGKECRLHVQKLNGIRGELDSQCSIDTEDSNSVSNNSEHLEHDEIPTRPITKKSKWMNYIDPVAEQPQQIPNETMQLNNIDVVLELPKKPRKEKAPRKSINAVNKTSNIHNVNATKCLPENNSVSTRILNSHTTEDVMLMNKKESNKTGINFANEPSKKIIHNKSVSPPVVTNSRWAQFVQPQEESRSCSDGNDIDRTVQARSTTEAVFTFLEDEDIDSILEL